MGCMLERRESLVAAESLRQTLRVAESLKEGTGSPAW